MTRRRVVVVLAVLVALPIVGLSAMSAISKRPDNLGVTEGRLAACPDSPNCVSTQADDETHRMEPIPYEGSDKSAMAKIKSVVAEMPRTTVITENETYLHVEFTSRVFRFVDDVEFYIDDEAKLIHFRSASRVGRSDLGVNRKRMTAISQELAARDDANR